MRAILFFHLVNDPKRNTENMQKHQVSLEMVDENIRNQHKFNFEKQFKQQPKNVDRPKTESVSLKHR